MTRLVALVVLAACNAQPVPPQPIAPVHREPVMPPAPLLRPLATTFTALDDDDATIPPGPSGAVGPSHLVSIAGTQLRIQSKTGTTLATQPVASLFTSLGHTAHAAGRVVYDPLASRWIVVAQADGGSAIEIAVSTTSDPTGAYHAYDLPVTVADATNVRVGFSSKLIAITADLVDHASQANQGARIYACAKAALYAGTATCHATDRTLAIGDSHSLEPALTYDADFDDELLVERDPELPIGPRVRLLRITGDVGTETISSVGFGFGVAPWASTGPQMNLGFAPQAGTLNRLDTGDDRITSAVVRNHHLFAAQTVYLPQLAPTYSAIQWMEIDPATYQAVQSGRIDGSSSAFDYAYPTIAVNPSNDVMIAFAKLGASISPSAAYASRMHGDTPGDLSSEALVRAGAGPYAKTHGGTVNRWGGAGGAASDGQTLWAIAVVAAAPDPAPCTVDCGNWTTVWAALGTDCTGQPNGTTCDTTLCTDGVQSCSGGACIGGSPTVCVPTECHATGACDPTSGCPQTLVADGEPCTEGVCSAGQCLHFPDDFPFDEDGGFFDDAGHGNPTTGGAGGCCQSGSGGGAGALLALGVLALVLRRRR